MSGYRIADAGRRTAALALALAVVLSAGGTALAIGVWGEGYVTQSPWQDNHLRIRIEEKKFTIMPGCPIYHRTRNGNGGLDQDTESAGDLRRGEFVLYRAEGRRLYEIIRMDRSLK